MARSWTPEQEQCIYATEGTLLVSAAAGSGKTSVLVERILNRITRAENPSDIDRLLVVTFTKAAAAEMKQRLQKALTDYMAEAPGNRRLLRQQLLLPGASISTVHGFCTALLREHFFRLDLAPNFTVAEESQTAPLQQQALSEVLETAYGEGDPAFFALTELIGAGKDDQKLFAEILRLYHFVQSHPDPADWLARMSAVYHDTAPLEKTALGKRLRFSVVEGLHSADQALWAAIKLCEEDPPLQEKYAPVLQVSLNSLRAVTDAMDYTPFDGWADLLQGIEFPRFGPAKGADERRKNRAKALRDRAKKDIIDGRLLPLLADSAADFEQDRAALAPLVDCLCSLTQQFGQRFAEKKRARRLVDFNDLEHLTLQLLTERQEDGSWRRTPLAEELAERFDEVLVDEYQDTNAAQDALFAALSRDTGNLFMVGDVKQSIYGFRQAMPEIFVEKRDRFPDFDGEHYPATIRLGCNFRSRRTVTESVNFLFDRIMQRPLGGIEYTDGEALVNGATYEELSGFETELILPDHATRAENDPRDRAEARVIARRIRELVGTLPVKDGEGTRPARYGDFCILLRSKNSHAAAYIEELERAGVPAWTSSAGGFFATHEIAVALSFLRVIDNPMQDVALLSVLCSPPVNFSPDDLAALRTARKKGSLFAALRHYARKGDSLADRCDAVLRLLDKYRTLAATMPADRLLSRLYDETDLPGLMSARNGGAQRLANLRLLLDLARRFEQDGFQGLSAFMRHIDRMTRQKQDVAPAAVSARQADAVRLMSIHNSKGLEFPVVFVGGLGSPFNREDLYGPLLMHPTAGLGLMRQESDTHKQYDTLLRRGVALAMRDSAAAEELRVLYVAMTRAKEKLCLVVGVNNAARTLTRLGAGLEGTVKLPVSTVAGAGCMGDWVLTAFLQHPDAGKLRSLAGLTEEDIPCEANTADRVRFAVVPIPPAEETATDAVFAETKADTALVARLTERFAYRYPYAALGAVPAKLAASHLAHSGTDDSHIAHARPAFLSRSGLTPAERGTALHAFLQFCDPATAADNVAAEVRRVTESGHLTAAQAASLELPKLAAFFSDPLFSRMGRSPRLMREISFAVKVPVSELVPDVAAELPADAADEAVVVQGIADCAFEEDGGLILVDYKTDRGVTASQLCERYAPQLRLYRRALTETLGLPVTETYIYSFALSRAIPLEDADA